MRTGGEERMSAAVEDCLEAILGLEQVGKPARVRDLAGKLAVHKSTVSATLKALAAKKLVDYSPYEIAALTSAGRAIAERVSLRHALIRSFLADVLLLDDAVADTNACRLEHGMDKAVADRLVLFAQFLQAQSGEPAERVKGFSGYVKRHGRSARFAARGRAGEGGR